METIWSMSNACRYRSEDANDLLFNVSYYNVFNTTDKYDAYVVHLRSVSV